MKFLLWHSFILCQVSRSIVSWSPFIQTQASIECVKHQKSPRKGGLRILCVVVSADRLGANPFCCVATLVGATRTSLAVLCRDYSTHRSPIVPPHHGDTFLQKASIIITTTNTVSPFLLREDETLACRSHPLFSYNLKSAAEASCSLTLFHFIRYMRKNVERKN